MNLDLQLDSNDDLEYFKTLFYRNIGTEQVTYNFYTDNVMVRINVSNVEDYQLVSIGIFHYFVQDKSTTLTQFCPLADDRYNTFPEVQQFWCWNKEQAWGSFTHGSQDADWAFDKVREILNIIYKVNKLKAFL